MKYVQAQSPHRLLSNMSHAVHLAIVENKIEDKVITTSPQSRKILSSGIINQCAKFGHLI